MTHKHIRDENGDVDRERTWKFEERRLRRRQVYVQELEAANSFLDPEDPARDAIRETAAFKALVKRLSGGS